jgi:hypothetical protein
MAGAQKTPLKADIIGNYYILGEKNRNGQIVTVHERFQDNGSVFLKDNTTRGINSTDQFDRKMLYNPGAKQVFRDKALEFTNEIKIIDTKSLKAYLLKNCGAQSSSRGKIDTVNDVINQTGQRIRLPSDVGGWENESNARRLIIPEDPHTDEDGNGFTNVEEWLHSFL